MHLPTYILVFYIFLSNEFLQGGRRINDFFPEEVATAFSFSGGRERGQQIGQEHLLLQRQKNPDSC